MPDANSENKKCGFQHPLGLSGISIMFHFRYTRHFNRLRNHSGHLWQNQYFSCAMDESHFMHNLRYVEQNPVRAGLAKQPWNYLWSNAKAHIGETDLSGLLNLTWRESIQNPGNENNL